MNFLSILKFFKENEEKIVLIIAGILIAILSFGVGRLTGLNSGGEAELVFEKGNNQNFCLSPPQNQENQNQVAGAKIDNQETAKNRVGETIGQFVASKNSNKYHLPSCRFAQKIKEENKIWFNSAEEAKQKGYSPCGTCLK